MLCVGINAAHKIIQAAAGCLEALGALEPGSGGLTERGRAMARLPVTPRHARMLLQVGRPVWLAPRALHVQQ